MGGMEGCARGVTRSEPLADAWGVGRGWGCAAGGGMWMGSCYCGVGTRSTTCHLGEPALTLAFAATGGFASLAGAFAEDGSGGLVDPGSCAVGGAAASGVSDDSVADAAG